MESINCFFCSVGHPPLSSFGVKQQFISPPIIMFSSANFRIRYLKVSKISLEFCVVLFHINVERWMGRAGQEYRNYVLSRGKTRLYGPIRLKTIFSRSRELYRSPERAPGFTFKVTQDKLNAMKKETPQKINTNRYLFPNLS